MTHIQIILYNSSRILPKLITGFNNVEKADEITLHFLENSEEDNETALQKGLKNIAHTHTRAPENLGFGNGHNYLFKKHGKKYGEYFIVLNPDIIPFFDVFTQLQEFISALPSNWGAVDLTQFPQEHPKDYQENFETEWASGAATAYRTKSFRKVGGFDPNIFMYVEDLDLSWRLRENKLRIFHCPTAKILHTIGGSTRSEHDQAMDHYSEFQAIHSHAANMYVRHKYFGKASVKEYVTAIAGIPVYDKVLETFNKAQKGLSRSDLKKYRSYKVPKIYPNWEYANHRW